MVVEWKELIAAYLFLGGLGAGGYITSAFADFWGKEKYEAYARFGAHLSWPIAIIGLALLLLDLGRPELGRLDHILNVFNNPTSMITIGTALLGGFTVIGILTSFLWIARWKRTLMRLTVESIGCIFAVGVALYTGFLLPLARGIPLWISPFLPWLFLVSAVSNGLVMVALANSSLGVRLFPRFTVKPEVEVLGTVHKAESRLIIAEFVLIVLFLGSVAFTEAGRTEIAHMMTGSLGMMFWGGVVLIGLLLPLVLDTLIAAHWKKRGVSARMIPMAVISFMFVLVGGGILRYVILLAGQM